jgi:hypothetical protein
MISVSKPNLYLKKSIQNNRLFNSRDAKLGIVNLFINLFFLDYFVHDFVLLTPSVIIYKILHTKIF